MTIAQFIVAYAVCWWLVLFMVLPSGANPLPTPVKGHAPSAPAEPRLRRKFLRASLWAFLPTILIYCVATSARAETSIYHVGTGCHAATKYKPSADVSTRDGYGAGDTQVRAADINPNGKLIDTDHIAIPLEIPAQNYIDRAAQRRAAADTAQGIASTDTPTSIHGRNVDLSHSFVQAGEITVDGQGEALLNGQSITKDTLNPEGCENE